MKFMFCLLAYWITCLRFFARYTYGFYEKQITENVRLMWFYISGITQKYSCSVSPENRDEVMTTRPDIEMVWTVGAPGGYNSREIQRSREFRLVVQCLSDLV